MLLKLRQHPAPIFRFSKHARWLKALRVYLGVMLAANLIWEALHLPLYTIWTTGSVREQAFAVVHCTLGDILIAASMLMFALIVAGDGRWPRKRYWRVAGLAMILGVGYTLFSEWLNVVVRKVWAYSELMPVFSLPGFEVALSPLLQWIILPAAAFAIARSKTMSQSAAGRDHR